MYLGLFTSFYYRCISDEYNNLLCLLPRETQAEGSIACMIICRNILMKPGQGEIVSL